MRSPACPPLLRLVSSAPGLKEQDSPVLGHEVITTSGRQAARTWIERKEGSSPAPESSCRFCRDRTHPRRAPACEALCSILGCVRGLAPLYVGRALSAADSEVYEAHFFGCAECLSEVENSRALASGLALAWAKD